MAESVQATLNAGYPVGKPFDTGYLKVGDIHTLYYEQYGRPDGKPVIFLHGGPGGGTEPSDALFFNPSIYRTVLLDQRGSGKSTPPAELAENTSQHLVQDIEDLRAHLAIPKWHMVFGGSWGSCLSLLYAQTHPDAVGSLVLRGIFTLRKSELAFFYQDGASHIYPDYFAPYAMHIPEAERGDLMAAYHARLTSDDPATRLQAAGKWSLWEMATSGLHVSQKAVEKAKDERWALAFARIEAHYFVNGGFIQDGQLLRRESVDRIRRIPAAIVQGRYDIVCPARTAYDLHVEWPEAEFHVIQDAGHSAKEPAIRNKLVEICDRFASLDV